MKRHFSRLHDGHGKPILQYIFANSIVTPEEIVHSPSTVVFPDQYPASHPSPEDPTVPPDPLFRNIQRVFNMDDKLFRPLYGPLQLQSEINSYKHSRNHNQPQYFSRPYTQPPASFISNPIYLQTESISSNQSSTLINYEGVSGFRADICPNCLTTIRIGIGPKNLGIHKCTPGMDDALRKQGEKLYTLELIRKLESIPEQLSRDCKDWADSTSGQLYLIATKVEHSGELEDHRYEIEQNYDKIPFLRKVLSESKIRLSDEELYQFLKFTKNTTKTIVTLRGKSGGQNLNYMIAVSTV
ncbi:MAG TPA: hypothetical protein VIA09_00315 [Nitrososphaeraceae archaeon]